MSVNAVLYGATALLVVSSLGMVSIYFGNPDNEGEATVANSEITQFPPRHVLHRTHPIAPQLFDGDDAIRINDSGNEMDTSAITATSVTKGPNPLRLYAPGTRPSTPFPRIRAVPFFKKTIRNFGEKDVLCFPGDLEEYHIGCKCCGGWEQGYMGNTCATAIRFDCTEEYKLTHYRRTNYPAYY